MNFTIFRKSISFSNHSVITLIYIITILSLPCDVWSTYQPKIFSILFQLYLIKLCVENVVVNIILNWDFFFVDRFWFVIITTFYNLLILKIDRKHSVKAIHHKQRSSCWFYLFFPLYIIQKIFLLLWKIEYSKKVHKFYFCLVKKKKKNHVYPLPSW